MGATSVQTGGERHETSASIGIGSVLATVWWSHVLDQW